MEGKGRKEKGEISLPFLLLRFIILSVSFHFPPPTGSRGRDPPSKRKKKKRKKSLTVDLNCIALSSLKTTSLPVIQGKHA